MRQRSTAATARRSGSFALKALIAGLFSIACIHAQGAQFEVKGVVNAATFQRGIPSGGALATVFCAGLGGIRAPSPEATGSPGTYTAPLSSPLPRVLGDVSISINGASAPILFVYIPEPADLKLGQVNFQVPMERNFTINSFSATVNDTLGTFVISGPGGSAMFTISALGGLADAGFFADAQGFATAQHASDNSPVTAQNPAHPGETIIAYGDDFFSVWPPPPMALPVPQQPSFQYSIYGWVHLYLQAYPTNNAPFGRKGTFTSTPALNVLFEGLAPGAVGVEQIKFVVPANQAPGDWALFFNEGSCPLTGGPCAPEGASSRYATLPVR